MIRPEPLLRPQPDGISRHVTPAEAADAFPMREQSLRDIERRRAMVEGLSAPEAALVFHKAGGAGASRAAGAGDREAMSGDLSSRVRQAILADLEKIEAYHHRRMMELRAADIWPEADAQQRLAETVRACIVTAQGAATRAIEEPQV